MRRLFAQERRARRARLQLFPAHRVNREVEAEATSRLALSLARDTVIPPPPAGFAGVIPALASQLVRRS